MYGRARPTRRQCAAIGMQESHCETAEAYCRPELAKHGIDWCAAMLQPIDDVEATLALLLRRYGPGACVAVLPEGPQTVPYIVEAVA
jgi:hypothetical protein